MEISELRCAVDFIKPFERLEAALSSDLTPDGRGMLSLSLQLLKLFEPFESQRRMTLDFGDSRYLNYCWSDGEKIHKNHVTLPYGNKRNAILMGSLLASAKLGAVARPVDYVEFRDFVSSSDKQIYVDFLGMDEGDHTILSYGDISRLLNDKGSSFIKSGIFERGYASDNTETIKLLCPPKEITIGEHVITPGMYSLIGNHL